MAITQGPSRTPIPPRNAILKGGTSIGKMPTRGTQPAYPPTKLPGYQPRMAPTVGTPRDLVGGARTPRDFVGSTYGRPRDFVGGPIRRGQTPMGNPSHWTAPGYQRPTIPGPPRGPGMPNIGDFILPRQPKGPGMSPNLLQRAAIRRLGG